MGEVDLAQFRAVDLQEAAYSRLMPCSSRVSVDLPEPERPTTPSMVPAGMVKLTRSSAGVLPVG